MNGNKRHLPRIYTDTNIKRAILLNVNEKIDTTYVDYYLDEDTFKAIMKSLIGSGVISRIKGKKGLHTTDYVIDNDEMFEKWRKGNFYRYIEKLTEIVITTLVNKCV